GGGTSGPLTWGTMTAVTPRIARLMPTWASTAADSVPSLLSLWFRLWASIVLSNMGRLLPGGTSFFEDETVREARSSQPALFAARPPRLGENGRMTRFAVLVLASIVLAACGGKPAEMVPPVGK